MSTSVIVTRKLPEQVEERMRQLFDVKLNADDRPMTQAELVEAVRHARVLVPTITDRIDAAVLQQAGPNLGLIANYGNGTDNIDVDAAAARKILVTNTPGVLTEDTADMTMAMILALPRRIVEGTKIIEEGGFGGWAPTWMMGNRVWGKRIGIVGMGRIGAAVAKRAKAFGMSVHYHNRRPAAPAIAEPLGATYWASLDQMLARMDFVSIHCPQTPATFHLLSGRRLALMKPEAMVINLARGDIVDEDALIKLIEEGKLAGAGLDVFTNEPAINPRLIKLAKAGKALLLPHMGSSTREGRIDMGDKVVINIRVFMDGHRPPDLVLSQPPVHRPLSA
ncbi:D-glycerate dehydrogenase [Acuticoccus sp. I52.16.1]|uniref:2-hydroxyacid dehydrogenase n=1 Tax=Acuticoccus sp. I52.16.1 TaxID=2928472 RepID=UPI001FD3C524|nr:D-glycerate dehydrogenase [Acuticoccus sp. I52.16.1]UOM35961.1 D-glycerate dehydrogenase [Acuticoccus sp. I52.16.1]